MMANFTNLRHRANLSDMAAARAASPQFRTMFDLTSTFVNTSVPAHFSLRTDYRKQWAAASAEYAKFLAPAGPAIGFFLGDELVTNGLPFASLEEYADAVRRAFPDAVIYSNEAFPVFTNMTDPKLPPSLAYPYLPSAISWFSVDLYPDYWSIGGARRFYESYIHPMLGPAQRTVLIPPMYGDAEASSPGTAVDDCGDANCTRAMLTWAEAFDAWARDDPRVVAVLPFHWTTDWTSCAAPPRGKGVRRCVGGRDMPAVRASWERIGRGIVAEGPAGVRGYRVASETRQWTGRRA
jgi:hypothetical protein